jgi:hypothetical protein
MDCWAKTLKNSLKSMPRDALQTRQLATLYGCSTEALRQCTTSSSQPSRSRVRACAMPLRANQGCGLWRVWALGIRQGACLSRRRVCTLTPNGYTRRSSPEGAAVRLAEAWHTLWRKVTMHTRRSIGLSKATQALSRVTTDKHRSKQVGQTRTAIWPLPTSPDAQAMEGNQHQ